MAKKLLKGFLFFLALLLLIIIFLPKKNLYYMLESQLLQENKIILSDETLKDQYLYLDVSNATLYYEGIEAGLVGNIKFVPLIFANIINVDNASFSSEISNIIPKKVQNLRIYHTIIDPLNINITAKGDFGEIFGFISLATQELFLELIPSESMYTKYRGILLKFKKVDNKYVLSTKLQ